MVCLKRPSDVRARLFKFTRSAIAAMGTIAVFVSFYIPEAANASATKDCSLSINEAVQSSGQLLRRMEWIGNEHLIGQLFSPGSPVRRWASWGEEALDLPDLEQADYVVPSKDTQRLAIRQNGRWTLHELGTGKRDILEIELVPDSTPVGAYWSSDGKVLAVIETVRSRTMVPDVVAKTTEENGVVFLDVGAHADRTAAAGSVSGMSRVFLISIDDMRVNELDLGGRLVTGGNWDSVGNFYYVTRRGVNDIGPIYTDLRSFNVTTALDEQIYRFEGAIFQSTVPVPSPDGNLIALAADLDSGRWEDFPSLAIINVEHRNLVRLTKTKFVNGRSLAWMHDQGIFFTARSGGFDQIYRANLDGQIESITDEPKLHYFIEPSPDGRKLAYITIDGYGRRALNIYDYNVRKSEEIHVLADQGKEFCLGEFRQVSWPTSDGLRIRGFLVLPPDFDPKTTYPLFVSVHGGDTGATLPVSTPIGKSGTPLEWHAIAARGYVVFLPSMRSSGEYGPEVAQKRYRDRETDPIARLRHDVRDIEEGVDWLLSLGFVDPRRMSIFGHSAGGGRVNLMLTESHRFSAGVIHDPIPADTLTFTLLRTSGENTGVPFDEGYFTNGIRMAEKPELFTGGALFDGYKSTTPTLILVGNEELGATPALPSEVLFTLLRQYDTPARMLRYTRDGHTPSTIEASIHRFDEVLAWVGFWLGVNGAKDDLDPETVELWDGMRRRHCAKDSFEKPQYCSD